MNPGNRYKAVKDFIVPHRTGEVTTYGLYPSSRKDAVNTVIGSRLGGNPSTTSDVYKNDSRELPAAKAFFNNKPIPDGRNVELMVKVPKGMTEKEFEELLRKNAEKYPTDKRPYNAWNGPNSVSDKIPPSGNGVSVCCLSPQGANDDKHRA